MRSLVFWSLLFQLTGIVKPQNIECWLYGSRHFKYKKGAPQLWLGAPEGLGDRLMSPDSNFFWSATTTYIHFWERVNTRFSQDSGFHILLILGLHQNLLLQAPIRIDSIVGGRIGAGPDYRRHSRFWVAVSGPWPGAAESKIILKDLLVDPGGFAVDFQSFFIAFLLFGCEIKIFVRQPNKFFTSTKDTTVHKNNISKIFVKLFWISIILCAGGENRSPVLNSDFALQTRLR